MKKGIMINYIKHDSESKRTGEDPEVIALWPVR